MTEQTPGPRTIETDGQRNYASRAVMSLPLTITAASARAKTLHGRRPTDAVAPLDGVDVLVIVAPQHLDLRGRHHAVRSAGGIDHDVVRDPVQPRPFGCLASVAIDSGQGTAAVSCPRSGLQDRRL